MAHTGSDIPKRYRGLMTIALALVVIVALAPSASAHAILLRTDPGVDRVVDDSPERVTLYFTEPVELALGAVRVYDTNAHRVDSGPAEHAGDDLETVQVPVLDDLDDGTYTVTWRIISADGHPIKGAFVFHVGTPGSKPQGIADRLLGDPGSGAFEGAAFGVARWTAFAGIVLLVGSALFLALVWRRKRAGLVRPEEVERDFARRWRRLALLAWVFATLGTLLSLVLQGAVAGGVGIVEALRPEVVGEILDTRYGLVGLVRVGLLLGSAAIFLAARARDVWPARVRLDQPASVGAGAVAPALPFWAVAGAGVVLAALVFTPGLAGHAGVTSPVLLNVIADGVHVASASAWLGGVATLALAAWPAARAVANSERPALLAPVVARFSDLAVVAIGVLVVTGTLRAYIEVRSLSGLTGSTYGWVLLAKLAVFLPILALGAVNNRILKPRLARAGDAVDAAGKMKRTVGAEVMLGAGVIAVTALLVNLPPARTEVEASGPFVADVRMGDDNLNVLLDPREVGANTIHLTLTEPSGEPVRVRAMNVRFLLEAEGIGPLVGKGKKLAPGHFAVQGRQISAPGDWTLVVTARFDRFTEKRVEVEVPVG
jgi:copper transport protein